ncbi:UDP-N-acetylglucosamine enolpyruvyl transferase [Zymobacter palmae]|uniref:UDP-N-acetylglucosamine enolpyruvyl transferase n=1 Tax=Zymobacter palmae TaxID=33074 RepID=A0A348HCA9_9GAMM|nr:UDP-N-acetylglucosamine enolpyruvyl transferase [Zymobacter palmae]
MQKKVEERCRPTYSNTARYRHSKVPEPCASVDQRTHGREQQHVTDRRAIGQQHDQTVDTDPFTCCRRHTVLERTDIVCIVVHGFKVTGILLGYLRTETLRLIFGIVQLREAVGDLATTDEELKAIGDVRILVVAACQRTDFSRILGNERRHDKTMFCHFFEHFRQQTTFAPVIARFEAQTLGQRQQRRLVGQILLGDVLLGTVFQHGFTHCQAIKRLGQVDRDGIVILSHLQLSGAQHGSSDVAQHVFRQRDQVTVVRKRPVELQHGELGVMTGRQTFVAEVAVDFEHTFEAAHDQTFEVQFWRDAQVHVHVERVVMRDKRTRRSTTRNRLQHWRFDFHERTFAKVLADRGDHGGTDTESIAHFRIHDQINVALTVAAFLIGQAVELVRQRTQALGQKASAFHHDVQITLAGFMHRPMCRHDVTDVPAFDVGQYVFRQPFLIDVQLDLSADVLDDDERAALTHDTTGNGRFAVLLFQRFLIELTQLGLQFGGQTVATEIVGERTASFGFSTLAQCGQLGATLSDQRVFLCCVSSVMMRLILMTHGTILLANGRQPTHYRLRHERKRHCGYRSDDHRFCRPAYFIDRHRKRAAGFIGLLSGWLR